MNICSSGNLEFRYVPERDAYMSSLKTLGIKSLMTSLVGDISRVLSQLVLGGIKHILCYSSGRGPLEACAWFPLDFTPQSWLGLYAESCKSS